MTFTASTSGSPPATVQWYVSTDGGKTFTIVAGATSTSLTIVATTAQNGYEYQAVFTESAGTLTTDVAILSVVTSRMTRM